jgi:CheY-like chemotaxis protein
MSEKMRPILAAEDEESDRMIMDLAFLKAKLSHPLFIVRDGQEAVDYLTGKGRYADRSAHALPALVVVDLKMPRMNGFDVLAWLAMQPDFKDIPAVVLSASSDESDMAKARQLGAREYFVKPHGFEKLIEIAEQMQARWLTAASPSASINPSLASLNRFQFPVPV